ncbi:MAG TPA: hypothetical protein VK901_12555 [Nitrospiraceae bacterium]|nr:hypothetical protein [Nitrospiraceae bacterium]
MATHTSEATVVQKKHNARNTAAAHASAVMPGTAIDPDRRCEARMDYRHLCSYEVIEAIKEESVVIEQGKAIALNRSTEGMLLFMRQAPHVTQLIEVRTPRSRWGRTMNVFDVRWITPVQVESFGNLYLVGCRRIFGPCHYRSF